MADIEYKLIFELENGSTKECHIISPQGPRGIDGTDGYTPVKGIDYFTDTDKEEIAQTVINMLPTWTGGSY